MSVCTHVSRQQYSVLICFDNDVSAVEGVEITVILLYCLILKSF